MLRRETALPKNSLPPPKLLKSPSDKTTCSAPSMSPELSPKKRRSTVSSRTSEWPELTRNWPVVAPSVQENRPRQPKTPPPERSRDFLTFHISAKCIDLNSRK